MRSTSILRIYPILIVVIFRIITKPKSSSGCNDLCTIADCQFSEHSGEVKILYQQTVLLPAFPCGMLCNS